MGMTRYARAHQLLPTVWRIPDFFQDFEMIRSSYRSPRQPWFTEYSNRLLTPWGSNAFLEQALQESVQPILELTGQRVTPQVIYASLDLQGSQIMMHRLHPDIRVYVQVFMGSESYNATSPVFCHNDSINTTRHDDYADISMFNNEDLTQLAPRPNEAFLMLNDPRIFFGTARPVADNQVREVVCLHFAAELPTST
jgi:hypothetical protein